MDDTKTHTVTINSFQRITFQPEKIISYICRCSWNELDGPFVLTLGCAGTMIMYDTVLHGIISILRVLYMYPLLNSCDR